MRLELNLKQKLLLLLLATISLSVTLVGGTLTFFAQRLHEEESLKRFAAARQSLSAAIRGVESVTSAQAESLAHRDDLVAALNMVLNYESKTDYQPLIFDPEKRRMAQDLEQEILSHTGESYGAFLAVYDGRGDLVSFAQRTNGAVHGGFVAYENGRAVLRPSRPDEVPAGTPPALPVAERLVIDESGLPTCPAPHGEAAVIEFTAPVLREVPGKASRVVGYVLVGAELGERFVRERANAVGMHLAVALPGTRSVQLAGNSADVTGLWGEAVSGATVDTENLLLQTLPITAGSAHGDALMVLAVDKAPLLAEIARTRWIVLTVLLVTAALALPVGGFMVTRTITNPVRRLVARVEGIKRGKYDGSVGEVRRDELGWLGGNIDEMAGTIRLREEQLRESQASLKEAQAVAQLGNWDWDTESGALRCSDEVARILGVDERPVGDYRFVLPFVVPDDRERVAARLEAARHEGSGYAAEYRLLLPNREVQTVHEEVTVRPLDEGGFRLFGTLQVVTELRRVEMALRKTNRALKTLSNCNEALVHATTESELLNEICRILVEVGRYRLAWVGFAEEGPDKRVVPVARAGTDDNYLAGATFSWADVPEGQGPTGTAIRTGRVQRVQDINGEPRFEPWRVAALARGYASSLAFPLLDEEGRAFGALNLYSGAPNAFDDDEVALLRELAGDLAYGINILRVRDAHEVLEAERAHYLERMQRSMQNTVQALSYTIELRDPYTAGHQRRVAELALAIAREMKLDKDHAHGVYLAGVVHDIGKINIPAEILTKPGRLSEGEFGLIKTHPVAGYEILRDVEFPWPIARMVQQHHERLDGSGYPLGLKGDAIMREARILTVADVVEAMATDRPYRPGLGLDTALEEVDRQRGVLYDPEVVDACLRVVRERGFSFSM